MSTLKQYLDNPVNINMARGVPSTELLDLSNDLLDEVDSASFFKSEEGIDIRNYGGFDGLKECKRLFSYIMNTKIENIFVGGNSSLNLMFDLISKSVTHGVCGSTPFSKLKKVKWLCIVPGYDRHFTISEYFGFEMINIPFVNGDPDMDKIEELIKDPSVKGIWCVPQYSNPSGDTYSKKCIERFSKLNPAAKDFRIYWDNAYGIHYLDKYEPIDDLLSLCDKNGHPDMVYMFASTSKITFAGAGVSALATSPNNMKDILNHFKKMIIGYDKINQKRHALYFKDKDALLKHMDKHALILRKKFDYIEDVFEKEFKGLATFSKPKGGYFICLKVDGKAKEVIELCKKCGVTLTDVGCAFPYHNDPSNSYIRIAPTSLSDQDIKVAVDVIVTVIKSLK